MGLLDIFRPRDKSPKASEFSEGFVQRTFSASDPVDKFYADIGLNISAVAPEAASPFLGVSNEITEIFIDPVIYRMMVAAEKVLERNGDILEGINAQIDLASGGLTVSHKDPGVQREYEEFFERVDINSLIEDTWLTEKIYGQAYPVSALVDDQVSFFALNPKRVAVGRQLSVGGRPYAYFDPAVRKEFYSMGLWWQQSLWNEWPEFSSDANAGAIIIDPSRIYHRHGRKPSFKRYAIPKAIGAWEAFTDRMSLGELTRHTIDGLKTQIRVWRIDRPQAGEITKLKEEISLNSGARTYDLVWTSGLQPVEHVIPGSIDALLANDTWMRMTKQLFSAMGMSMTLSGGTTGEDEKNDLSIVVAVALSRLNSDLRANCQLATWCVNQWITLERPDLAKAGLPSLGYIPPIISQEHALRGIVPLLNYGGISIETTLQKLGYDPKIEMEKLRREMSLRGDGNVIYPYPSFGQVSPGGQTTSQQSPGRPQGPDMNPENAAQNSENARGRRNTG